MSEPTPIDTTNSIAEPNYLPTVAGVRIEGCRSYEHGHALHPTQVRVAGERPWEPARIDAVDGHFITVSTERETLRLWNHNPKLLRTMADIAALEDAATVRLSTSCRLLAVTLDDRGVAAHVASTEGQRCIY